MSKYAESRRLDVERSKAIIAALGGQSKVAHDLGLTPGAVYHWAARGIPEARLQFMQRKFVEVPEVQASLDWHPWTDRMK